jgi:hypothetical protein
MIANPPTAQIAPAAAESFAGQSGRRPAGPLFDALILADARAETDGAADPVMDSIRKGRVAAPWSFPGCRR